MTAPNRQLTFRRSAVLHVLIAFVLGIVLAQSRSPQQVIYFAHAMLVLGIVEGATLIGWRLTQLPKSQALEFLLVSPLQPKPVFLAEALVGIARFSLISLTGLPVFLTLWFMGLLQGSDIVPLLAVPWTWGILTGLVLTGWAYESVWIRKVGDIVAIGSVIVYLVVGVLAAERLRDWLQRLPPVLGKAFFDLFQGFHQYNPFGILQYWFAPDRVPWLAIERLIWLQSLSLLAVVLLLFRCAYRMREHFHDRHYKPIDSSRVNQSALIGDKPLSWWAVRRVMEYSGRVNIWLAGGFGIVYAAYIVAGDAWPPWMGRLVFQLFEKMGGAAVLATGLVVLSAVPAAFQYGLWDSTTQDRCKRLELLLLTDLQGGDYWHAAAAAALRRGRGYFYVALILWLALLIAGRVTPVQVLASLAAGIILWGFSFALGFRAFASGRQANGLGSMLTLGLPLVTWGLLRAGLPGIASLLPPGAVYLPLAYPLQLTWCIGPIVLASVTLLMIRRTIENCDRDLRIWYDRNQGTISAD